MRRLRQKLPPGREILPRIVISILAIPYYRFFTRNTLWPAQEVLKCANAGYERGSPARKKLHLLLLTWQERKRDELSFTAIVSIAMTAVVSASFSWPVIQQSFWLGPACWYATLMWAVFGILVGSQQMSMLYSIGDLPKDHTVVPTETLRRHLFQFLFEVTPSARALARLDRERPRDRWLLSWKSIFIWQLPLMAFGYAFLLYIIGLTVVVCTPLMYTLSGDDFKIAMFYVVSCGIGAGLFIYSALFGYKTIELAEDRTPFEEDILNQAADLPTVPEDGTVAAARKEFGSLVKSFTGGSQMTSTLSR